MQSKSCNVALVQTGGTISSGDNGAGYLAAGKADIAACFPSIPFSRTEKPVEILSENETFGDIRKAADCIAGISDADGIIVTHGTDSLAFFSAATALLLADIKIPVVIVSANYPLSDERSNGRENMQAAYEFIKLSPAAGVYVSYKNDGENVKIHYGARLNLSRGFDGYVSSADNRICGEFIRGKFVYKNKPTKKSDVKFPVRLCADGENKVRYVVPYVGLDYIALNRAAKADSAEIMHDSFHSGTVKTSGENSINALQVPVFLAGGTEAMSRYESLAGIGEKINVYDNISPVALYFKLVLSQDMDAETRKNYLKSCVAHEYF